MRRILLLTTLLCLLAPSVAAAATRHVVRGAGFGHGIGMSQYGALGFAQKGKGYREILSHYYTGTQLSSADARTIRVLLQSGRDTISFRGATGITGRRLDPNRMYRVTADGLSGVRLRDAGGDHIERLAAPVQVTSSSGVVQLLGTAINGLKDGRYRGSLELQPGTFGGMVAVNAVSLDDYVQGVVPEEVPGSWPAEVLKAQAVAARSYALTTDAGGALFDQYPDTRSQVYRGVDREEATSNAAVQATAGEVLRHSGKVAVTYFFSTSGGRTENIENVFYNARPVPYLVSVDDPYDEVSPRHRWRLSFSSVQLQAKLRGLVKGRFRRIRVIRRGRSPRIVQAEVWGSRGRSVINGATLRSRLGLFDTWAYFTTVRTSRSGSTARASSSRGLAIGIAARPRGALLYGEFTPRPRGGRLALEYRSRGGHWREVGRVSVSSTGAYRAQVHARGLYRVRGGAVSGPPVRVG
jgi:stage II sporulation protein D